MPPEHSEEAREIGAAATSPAASPSSMRCKVARWTFKVRAKAAMDESSLCCSPTKASFAIDAFWAGRLAIRFMRSSP
jgi:hypothetical protein